MENRVVVRSDDNCTFNVEKNNGEIVIEVHSIVKDVVKQVAVADGMSESNCQLFLVWRIFFKFQSGL